MYVNDLFLLTSEKSMKVTVKKQLHKKFKIKDLEPVSSLLGMRVRNRKEDKISIELDFNQLVYIKEILKRFNMMNANPVKSPLDSNQKLSEEMSPKTTAEISEMEWIPYRQ